VIHLRRFMSGRVEQCRGDVKRVITTPAQIERRNSASL
jgi:hypothetical protein